jgi:RNA polymerase sigma factor (sigma-70 family)
MSLLVKNRKLLRAFRKGEPWALEEVYEYYSVRLRRYLQSGFTFESRGRICRYAGASTGQDIEWVVQETFARAFDARTRRTYDGQRPFLRYLQTVARNLLLRELNRTRRLVNIDDSARAEHEDNTASLAVRQTQSSPEQIAEQRELRTMLAAFMASLDDEEARFVDVRFINGLTQEGTARSMNKTRARIKVLEASLRKRFLDLFRDNGYFVDCAPKPRWTRKDAVA